MKTKNFKTKKIIALTLVFVLIGTMLEGCGKKELANADVNETGKVNASQSEENTVSEEPTASTDEDNTGAVSQTENDSSTSTEGEVATKNGDSETTTRKSSSNKTETTTKKTTTSTGSSGKETTTTKPSPTNCTHSWSEYKWGTTEATYGDKYRTCSKCGKTESWEKCSHTYGAWNDINLGYQERTCSKCGWAEGRNADNAKAFMGNKNEYLELLGYINQARREAGLNELIYLDEFQEGANIRAIEITKSFSHTRPNGDSCYTAYANNGVEFRVTNENIAYGVFDAKSTFEIWMRSEGHRNNILSENGKYFVCARCSRYWVMSLVNKI